MATLTNYPLEGDGVLENLYYYLWCKDEFDGSPKLYIPHTILYQYTQPAQWYFTNSAGKIMKKNKVNIINVNIKHAMTNDTIEGNIVSMFLFINEQGTDVLRRDRRCNKNLFFI